MLTLHPIISNKDVHDAHQSSSRLSCTLLSGHVITNHVTDLFIGFTLAWMITPWSA